MNITASLIQRNFKQILKWCPRIVFWSEVSDKTKILIKQSSIFIKILLKKWNGFIANDQPASSTGIKPPAVNHIRSDCGAYFLFVFNLMRLFYWMCEKSFPPPLASQFYQLLRRQAKPIPPRSSSDLQEPASSKLAGWQCGNGISHLFLDPLQARTLIQRRSSRGRPPWGKAFRTVSGHLPISSTAVHQWSSFFF